MSSPDSSPRTGYVTLVGRPNAGKSTLMNALVGERLSIVTPKAQTTWQRVTGIHTGDDVQMIFLDTPGLLEPANLFQRSMLAAALDALREADVLLLIIDPTRPLDEAAAGPVQEALTLSSAPRFVAVNKIDLASPESVRERVRWAEETLHARAFPVSALRGEGLEELATALAAALPEAPFLYPPDEIASQPVRFFVAEMVRETVFELYRQEIPYSVACRVEEFREHQQPVYIGVGIFVERESQKGIVVGKKGAGIRELGRLSRKKIERFIGRPVYLDLWVKTMEGWSRKASDLARLGFQAPPEDPR